MKPGLLVPKFPLRYRAIGIHPKHAVTVQGVNRIAGHMPGGWILVYPTTVGLANNGISNVRKS